MSGDALREVVGWYVLQLQRDLILETNANLWESFSELTVSFAAFSKLNPLTPRGVWLRLRGYGKLRGDIASAWGVATEADVARAAEWELDRVICDRPDEVLNLLNRLVTVTS